MNELKATRHGMRRMRQRGMKNDDVPRILAHATQVDDGTWILRNRDVHHAIKEYKQEIQALKRLRNFKLVTCV